MIIYTVYYVYIQTKDLLEITKDELRYGINNINIIQHHNELINICRTKVNRIYSHAVIQITCRWSYYPWKHPHQQYSLKYYYNT